MKEFLMAMVPALLAVVLVKMFGSKIPEVL